MGTPDSKAYGGNSHNLTYNAVQMLLFDCKGNLARLDNASPKFRTLLSYSIFGGHPIPEEAVERPRLAEHICLVELQNKIADFLLLCSVSGRQFLFQKHPGHCN